MKNAQIKIDCPFPPEKNMQTAPSEKGRPVAAAPQFFQISDSVTALPQRPTQQTAQGHIGQR